MTHEERQDCFYAARNCANLLRDWRATSDDDKRMIVREAMLALDKVPMPDDLLTDDDTVVSFSEEHEDK